MLILSKTQSNGRVKPQILYKPAWDPDNGCVLPPLGSPSDLQKRSYVHVPVVPYSGVHDAQNGGAGLGCTTGGYTGWVPGRVIPGYTQPARFAARRHPDQRSGPRKPYRGWSGWVWGSGITWCSAAGAAPSTTLRARSVSPGALPVLGP